MSFYELQFIKKNFNLGTQRSKGQNDPHAHQDL